MTHDECEKLVELIGVATIGLREKSAQLRQGDGVNAAKIEEVQTMIGVLDLSSTHLSGLIERQQCQDWSASGNFDDLLRAVRLILES